jgi:hypothetical protein
LPATTENARVRIFSRCRQGLRIRLRILRRKSRALAPAFVPVAVITSGQCGAVAVIHGRGVNAVFVFPAQARSGPLPALIVGTASAPPSSSSSATTTGGSSWSCVHSPRKLLCIDCLCMLQNFTKLQMLRRPRPACSRLYEGKAPPDTQNWIYESAGSNRAHSRTNPNSWNKPLFENETFNF